MSEHNQNIYLDLERTARRLPDKKAIVAAGARGADGRYSYRHVTYGQLVADIERCSDGLAAAGLAAGTRVLMMVPPGVELAILSYALFRLGAVPVYIDAGSPVERMLGMITESAPGAMVTVPTALNLKRGFPQAFEGVTLTVVLGGSAEGAVRYEDLQTGEVPRVPPARLEADDLMMIAYTSGSTGAPKGVEFTPRMMRAILAPMGERYGLGEDDIDLVTFPINLLTMPPSGVTLVLPDMDAAAPGKVDPARIVQTLLDQGCTSSLGSPVFWGRVAQHCVDNGIQLSTLRRVLLAGAPVPGALLRRLAEILPNGWAYTPIGSTECGPLAAMDGREILSETVAKTERGEGICVGYPFAGHEVRVIEITDGDIPDWKSAKVLEPGQTGELVIKGPGASPRYFRRPDATRRAKIYEDGGAFWHRMGDAGYLDDRGRVWFCGRIAHIIDRGGERYYPIKVESMFNAEPDIFRTALVEAEGSDGAELVLCVEFNAWSAPGDPDKAAQRAAELKAKGERLGLRLSHVLIHQEGFPVDARHNAKIDVRALREWASKRLAARS